MPGRPVARLTDDLDRRLLALLHDDGRLSVNELAHRADISRANAYSRLQRLRDTGVIEGFTVRVDPHKVGMDVAALVLVGIEQRSWRDMAAEVLALPGVEYLAFTTGGFDFVLLVRVPDVETLRDVVLEGLQSMPGVRSTQTIFILDEFRR